MQPPVRQFPPSRIEHTPSASAGQLDPLLQFDSEDRNKNQREQAVVQGGSSAAAAPLPRIDMVVRPQRMLQAADASTSNARRLAWPVMALATCGGVLAAVILVKTNVPARIPAHTLAPPVAAAGPVATVAPGEIVTEPAAFAPATTGEKALPAPAASPQSPANDARDTASAESRAVRPTTFYGSLAIDSVPASARVYINGKPIGSTPLVLTDLPVGSRAIRLEADGHASWSSTVRVVAGERARVNATLTPSR
jgi:hypothetical protein